MSARRSIFRVLVDFVRTCEVTHHSSVSASASLVTQTNTWDRIVIYYNNGQKEITNLVNSVFNAHPSVEVRKVIPADYSLFQAADLCRTLALLRRKVETVGLSQSGCSFFSTAKESAERALKKGYFKTMDRKRFGG